MAAFENRSRSNTISLHAIKLEPRPYSSDVDHILHEVNSHDTQYDLNEIFYHQQRTHLRLAENVELGRRAASERFVLAAETSLGRISLDTLLFRRTLRLGDQFRPPVSPNIELRMDTRNEMARRPCPLNRQPQRLKAHHLLEYMCPGPLYSMTKEKRVIRGRGK